MVAAVARPFAHSRSTSKPPRARNPRTDPAGHAAGSAGNNRIASCCDCSSISAIAALAPRLPSTCSARPHNEKKLGNDDWVSNTRN